MSSFGDGNIKTRIQQELDSICWDYYGCEFFALSSRQKLQFTMRVLEVLQYSSGYNFSDDTIFSQPLKNNGSLYKVDVWKSHGIIDSFETNTINELNDWLKNNKYDQLYDDFGCAIYVYKNGYEMSSVEMQDEDIIFLKK